MRDGNMATDVMSYLDLFEAGIVVEDEDGDAAQLAAEPEALAVEDDQLVLDDEKQEDPVDEQQFGHYLVEVGALKRYELTEAVREQARQPGVRLAEIIAYMGYLPYREVDRLRGAYFG
jgi:hypothetical protein